MNIPIQSHVYGTSLGNYSTIRLTWSLQKCHDIDSNSTECLEGLTKASTALHLQIWKAQVTCKLQNLSNNTEAFFFWKDAFTSRTSAKHVGKRLQIQQHWQSFIIMQEGDPCLMTRASGEEDPDILQSHRSFHSFCLAMFRLCEMNLWVKRLFQGTVLSQRAQNKTRSEGVNNGVDPWTNPQLWYKSVGLS